MSITLETVELDLPALAARFGRRLSQAGVPVTPERAARFAEALTLVRPVARRRLYWTARTTLVSDSAHVRAFDAVFREVFGSRVDATEPDPDAPREPAPPDARPPAGRRDDADGRAADAHKPAAGALTGARRAGESDPDLPELPIPIAASDEERLRAKRFETLEPAELSALYRLMAELRIATPRRRTRRADHDRLGDRIDLRRTLRASLRTGGEPMHLARRRRRVLPRRLVLLCDISGSMEPYARAYLHFLTSAAGSGPHAEAFVFATRLTRITRALASRSPEQAISRAAEAAPDWSSGTRIGAALREFNDRHGRRGMARGAVIVILSDGWERGDPALVGREMERLSRLAYRIVWVNPRASARGFAPRAGGMAAALPYVDALVSGDSLAALAEVVDAIGAVHPAPPEVPDPVDDEPWASATPVPGSSVAMPSGYGPSRGNTTPGWSR
ncbi:MAG TPA: VWA domain-containing protein [Thermoleophilaceae bacterium]